MAARLKRICVSRPRLCRALLVVAVAALLVSSATIVVQWGGGAGGQVWLNPLAGSGVADVQCDASGTCTAGPANPLVLRAVAGFNQSLRVSVEHVNLNGASSYSVYVGPGLDVGGLSFPIVAVAASQPPDQPSQTTCVDVSIGGASIRVCERAQTALGAYEVDVGNGTHWLAYLWGSDADGDGVLDLLDFADADEQGILQARQSTLGGVVCLVERPDLSGSEPVTCYDGSSYTQYQLAWGAGSAWAYAENLTVTQAWQSPAISVQWGQQPLADLLVVASIWLVFDQQPTAGETRITVAG